MTKAQALENGFTADEWLAYTQKRYSFAVPPVCTAEWNDLAWMSYIFGPRKGKAND